MMRLNISLHLLLFTWQSLKLLKKSDGKFQVKNPSNFTGDKLPVESITCLE